MFLNPFTRRGRNPHLLAVSMTGVKLGDRAAVARETARILRPGGRVVLVGGGEPTGLNKLMAKTPASPLVVSGAANSLLEANGFGIVRTLAEREGLVFVEGLKPRTPVTR